VATGSPSCDPTRSSPPRPAPGGEVDAAVARYRAGATSLAELARTLGVTRDDARVLLARRGVAIRQPGRPSGRSALADVLTEPFLRSEVGELGRRVTDVAESVGCSPKTVRAYLAKWAILPARTAPEPAAGVPVVSDRAARAAAAAAARAARPVGGHRSGTGLSRQALWDAYVVAGMSTTALAAMTGCAPSTVVRDLRHHDIPVRSRGGAPPAAIRRRDRRAGIRRALVRADT